MGKRRWAKTALVALPLLAAGIAHAGPLEVSPVTMEMAPGRMATTLTVTNHGTARTAIQVRSFAWAQGGTEDTLTRTDDLVVSPPMFQLGPNEAQTVRLMARRPAQGSEASYRLLLDELPAGREPGAIQLALRLSLPVFVAPAGQTAPDLAWRVVQSAGGAEVRVLNRGTRRDRIADVAVALPGGASVKPAGLQNPYVLPGVERRLRLPVERGALRVPQVRIVGRDDFGQLSAPAPVQAEP